MRSAVIKILSGIGSLRLTLAAMLVLAATALVTYKNLDIPISWVVLPLTLLGLNLLAAIVINKRFRSQGGLLLFHLGLLGIIVLAAVDVMTSMEARLEITEGEVFDAADVEIVQQGPWHSFHLDQVKFTQGPVQVGFVSARRRGDTRSQIWVPDEAGRLQPRVIGDRQTLKVSGYRFITTGNKGYSVILTWIGDDGFVSSGAINMPSYPFFEWKQQNQWTTPQGQQLSLSLQASDTDRPGADSEWTLDSENIAAQLRVKAAGPEQILESGDIIRLEQGSIRFDEVRVWMGYRIDYNPMLVWQFISALFALGGLGFHFWRKFFRVPLDRKTVHQQALEHSLHA